MTGTPLFDALKEKADRYEGDYKEIMLNRLRTRYHRLRDAGFTAEQSKIASHWPDERIDALIKELNG